MNIDTYFHITHINHMAGLKYVGTQFDKIAQNNLEYIKNVLNVSNN